MPRERVLLLKVEDESAASYHDAFAGAYPTIESSPQLDFIALTHTHFDDVAAADAVSRALRGFEAAPDGVIITSLRACVAMEQVLPLLGVAERLRWDAVSTAFVVGTRAARATRSGSRSSPTARAAASTPRPAAASPRS